MFGKRRQKVNEIIAAAKRRQPEKRSNFPVEISGEINSPESKTKQPKPGEKDGNSFFEPQTLRVEQALKSDSDELGAGEQIDNYRIIKKIGSGGMGKVYLAHDFELKRDVALKVLPDEFTGDKNRVQRFQQEAYAASRLNHPNILTIHKIGQTKQIHYIVTEFVEGKTLRDILSEGITLGEALDIVIQIASALKAAHAAGIVHRDIKPENVMVRPDGYVKVLDFGLAKLVEGSIKGSAAVSSVQTQSGFLVGTPVYMSPEQIEGGAVDNRTDLFSLGSLFYECLTGQRIFQGETVAETISKIASSDPLPPSKQNPQIPLELDAIALKLLQKKPEKRYQTAGELTDDLLEINSKVQRVNLIVTKPIRRKAKTSGIRPLSTFSKFVEIPRNSIALSIVIISILFLAYYFLIPKKAFAPKTEAAKLFNEGTEAIRDNSYFKAAKLLEDAVKADDDFAPAHARLAEAWMELDYVGRAQKELLKARDLQQNQKSIFPTFSQSDDAIYIAAINATVQRDFAKAVENYEIIARKYPDKPYAYIDLGRAYEKKEEIDKAIETYEKAVNLDSQYAAAFLRLGILHSRKAAFEKANENFDKAENLYDRSSSDEGVAEVKYQRGYSLNSQEKLAAARNQFEMVLNIPRANKFQQIRAMLQISSVCYSGGNNSCGEEFAAKAVKTAKDERMENLATIGLINLGNVFLAAGDYEKAERQLVQALEFARKDQGLRNEASALLTLGSLRIQQRKPDEAQNFVRQALPFFQNGGYNKEISQSNLLLGRAAEMSGDYNAALKVYEEIENSEKASVAERAYAKMVSGNVLLNKEKFPQALSRFQQSYDLYKSLESPFYITYTQFYLSTVLFRLGRFEEAKQQLSQAESSLKEGHSLISQAQIKTRLLSARIELSNRNFSAAISEARKINLAKDKANEFEVNKLLCLAQTGLNSKNSEGVKNCTKALQYAENTEDLRTIIIAKLAAAEAFLNTGDHSSALKTALETTDYFLKNDMAESSWRAWIIAGQACAESGDGAKAKEYAGKATEIFSKLQNDWGDEHFYKYVVVPSINFYFKRANELAKSF